jgi:hypothetical protein
MKNRLLFLAIAWVILAMWQTPNARADYSLNFVQTIQNGINEDYITQSQSVLASGGSSAQYTEQWWVTGYSGTYYYNVNNSSGFLIDRVIAEVEPASTTFIIQTGSAITSQPGNATNEGTVTAIGGTAQVPLSIGSSMTNSSGSITVDTYFVGPDVVTPITGAIWLFGPGLVGLLLLKRRCLG